MSAGSGASDNERSAMASWLRANEVPLPPGLVSGASGGVAPGNGGLSIPPGGGSPANPAVAGPVTLFNQLIKKWEDTKASTTSASFDPTEILCQIADILEKETDIYLSKDPDPFMDRHPSRVNPDCPFGQLLKTFFKKESFVEALFQDYTRDNYWSRLGQSKSAFDLNVAACRVILDIQPGLQKEVLETTDGLIKRFYAWAKSSPEPLQSYATGLLGAAMEIQTVAADPENREQNQILVPEIIKRLRLLRKENEDQKSKADDSFKRPFQMFGGSSTPSSPRKSPSRRMSTGEDEPQLLNAQPFKTMKSPDRGLNPGWPSSSAAVPSTTSGNTSPAHTATADWSNSSWAEMESKIIGHFPIHPLTLKAKQSFIFRLLTPLGEYQEFLTHMFERKVLDLLIYYINIRETKDARLSFEALRFCCAVFCHKKFLLEFVSQGGIQLFLEVPRPSIAATAVAQCLYYLAHDDDVMEKVCLLPQPVLASLIKYVLWLVECSHDSGRQWAVMFCGMITSFRVLLDTFDQQDGVRKLFNSINTLEILNSDDMEQNLTDDQEYQQRLFIRYGIVTFKQYFHAHLGIKAQELRKRHQRDPGSTQRDSGTTQQTSFMAASVSLTLTGEDRSLDHLLPLAAQPTYKPARYTSEQLQDHIEAVFELLPFRGRWQALDNFVQLGGITTCLKVIASAYDWTFQGRCEMVRSALDILTVAAILPKVQLQLCEKVPLPDDTKPVGMSILLGASEGEIVQESAEVQRAALGVLISCVCAPVERRGPGYFSWLLSNKSNNGSAQTPGSTSKRKPLKTSEEVIDKIWNTVRENNGIMVLLDLLNVKAPITDADSLRAMACRALVGLARSEHAQQIMSKLPIFTNNQLQQLVREPILQDKMVHHVKFTTYAYYLIEMVMGPRDGLGLRKATLGQQDEAAAGLDMASLHRASVVATSNIAFPRTQLLQLIHQYLTNHGLGATASALTRETGIDPLPPKTLTAHGATNGTPLNPNTPSLRNKSTPGVRGAAKRRSSNYPSTPSSTPSTVETPMRSDHGSATPTPIRLNRKRPSAATPTPGSSRNSRSHTHMPSSSAVVGTDPSKTSSTANSPFANGTTNGRSSVTDSKRPLSSMMKSESSGSEPADVTLDSIITKYLATQHSLCRNPMSTCPEFDLLRAHKCPDPRAKNSVPTNFLSRVTARAAGQKWSYGFGGLRLDKRLIYSRFRPVRVFRNEESNDNVEFTACALMPDPSDFILVGTHSGEVKMFDIHSQEQVSSYTCHEENQITVLRPNSQGNLLLTANRWREPYARLWSIGEFFERKMDFNDSEYVEFSKLRQDKVIGTDATIKEKAVVWDLQSQQIVREFSPQCSNNYTRNQATFNLSDELVLNDGVLYDMRMGREIRKLDKLNQNLNGVFHPNGLEIISSSEIWDIRTFHLLKTVKGLDNCTVTFTNSGDIIYAVGLEQEMANPDEDTFGSSFKTFDASDYSLIATIETKRAVLGVSPSSNDQQLAVVENPLDTTGSSEESIVRLYDVGRHKAEDEDIDDEDNDDDDDVEDGEEDGIGFDSNDEDGSDDGSSLGSGSSLTDSLSDLEDAVGNDDDDLDVDMDGGAGEGELLDMIANMARAQGRREARRVRRAHRREQAQEQAQNQDQPAVADPIIEQQAASLADNERADEEQPQFEATTAAAANEDDEWEDIEEEVVLEDDDDNDEL